MKGYLDWFKENHVAVDSRFKQLSLKEEII
jgi:hypothetical protein